MYPPEHRLSRFLRLVRSLDFSAFDAGYKNAGSNVAARFWKNIRIRVHLTDSAAPRWPVPGHAVRLPKCKIHVEAALAKKTANFSSDTTSSRL
ncbi:MAG: hypothetical protein RIF32_21235 [Leptospirales bacterium]